MKIIVTGERDWPDDGSVYRELERYAEKLVISAGQMREPLVIVHGACPTGADQLAEQFVRAWARRYGVRSHQFPVNHALDGPWPGAGPHRNRRMVDAHLDADFGLAFWSGKRERSGTLDCMSYMTMRGIRVWTYPKEVAK